MSFTILSIGVLGFIGAFTTLSKSIHFSKTRAVANNLLQEKVEALKDVSYYRLIPTTAPWPSTEAGIPLFQYDNGFYPAETMRVGDITYIRRVFVEKVSSGGAGEPTPLAYQAPDSGLKRIKAYILWQDRGAWNMEELQNLVNNPNRQKLEGQVTGTVALSGGGIPTGAVVMTLQNASRFDVADAAGAYAFYVAPGTYTLEASLSGYFTQTLQNAIVTENTPYTWNPTLVRMSSGTVNGTAYLRDHPVISRVAGHVMNGAFAQEYVELYNPTTYTWTVNGNLRLEYENRTVSPRRRIEAVFTNATIPSNGYFLFANAAVVRVNGVNVTADAVWDTTAGGWNDVDAGSPRFDNFTPANPDVIDYASGGNKGEGALVLYDSVNARVLDAFGWTGSGGGTPHTPSNCEGSCLAETTGLQAEEQYYRRYQAGSALSTAIGPAYDTQNNDADWEREATAVTPPQANASGVDAPQTGTPAASAYVSADDGLSEPTVAGANGAFSLVSVATGTWSVNVSSGANFRSQSAAITSNGQVVALGTVAVTSTTQVGFVMGTVRSAQTNAPVSGITVQDASGLQAVSGGTGRYSLSLSSGITFVTANPGNTNASYVSETVSNVNVDMGVYTTDVDFTLASGGKVRGLVRIGANPLPGIPITAYDGTTVESEAVSDANGYFTLSNLSTGTYSVEVQLEPGETYSPGPATVTLASSGQQVWSDTFTVSNAFGWVTGSLTASGQIIQTGVTVFATTSTLAGAYPPDVNNALRTGIVKYYAASSLTDGTYELALPGGNPGTPITYNIYGWYTTWNGTTATVVRRNTTGAVTGGQTTTGRDMSW